VPPAYELPHTLIEPSALTIKAWGNSSYGGTGAPSDSGYTKIYSNWGVFAALKADGSIKAWGSSYNLDIAPTRGCTCASRI
jgi:hypothetical protein